MNESKAYSPPNPPPPNPNKPSKTTSSIYNFYRNANGSPKKVNATLLTLMMLKENK
jgi:hypothetical protein